MGTEFHEAQKKFIESELEFLSTEEKGTKMDPAIINGIIDDFALNDKKVPPLSTNDIKARAQADGKGKFDEITDQDKVEKVKELAKINGNAHVYVRDAKIDGENPKRVPYSEQP